MMNVASRICLLANLSVAGLAATVPAWATCPSGLPLTTPNVDFQDAGNGTVAHLPTGLIWKRCPEGQTWDGATCTGAGLIFTWEAALGRAADVNTGAAGTENAGMTDWRLPNIKELRSINEQGCYQPSINAGQFPATPNQYFWSSSPVAGDTSKSWVMHFGEGVDDWRLRTTYYAVRLVRDGLTPEDAYDAANPDSDNDGQFDSVEDAAPNGGDGNGDGIPDRMQPGVTSLPKANGGGHLTLTTTCGNGLTGVAVHPEDQNPGGGDPGYDMPYGLVEFGSVCESGQFTILYHGVNSIAGMTYRKYGPVTPGASATAAWYTLPGMTPGTVTVSGQTVATATFTLADDALGDDTGDDGVIVDQGGPGISAAAGAQAIPTLSGLGMILLSGLLGLGAAYAGRRRIR